MRLSSLCIAAVFLFSSVAFSQHGGGSSGGSSGGGSASSGGGSSSSGGGGSHSSGGGSSSSGSGSSGGHSSGGSGSHSSGSHGSSGSTARGSTGSGSASNGASHFALGASGTSSRLADMLRSGEIRVVDMRVVNDKNETVVLDRKTTQQAVEMVKAGRSEQQISNFIRARANSTPVSAKIEIQEHRGFLGVLRHPFRREPVREVKIVGELRRPPSCKGSHCPVCPAGRASCGYLYHERTACSSGELWNGGACLMQTQFLDNCSGLRMTLERQKQRMAAAESMRQNACAAGSPDCASATTAWQSEESLYRSLSARYLQCQRQSTNAYSMGGYSLRGYGPRISFDPLWTESSY